MEMLSLRKIVTGIAFVSSSTVLRLLAQFIVLPVLSRLLTSTDYGLIAIASPFITYAMMLSDAGLGMSLVRSAPLKDHLAAWSTSFWLITALGGCLTLLLSVFSPVAALTFGDARLELIIIILSFTIGVQAASVIPGAALQQAGRFSTIAAIEITATVLGMTAAVTAAFLGSGVWALVAQQSVFFSTRLVLTLIRSPFRPRLVFNLAAIKSHFVFGRDVLAVNMVAQFSGSIDNLAIGRVLGPAPLGFYSMAFQFTRLPSMIVTGPLQFVLYSHLASVQGNLPAIRGIFLFFTRALAIIIFPTLGMLAVAHVSIFATLLSAKWSQSGTIFMILATAGAVQAMMALGGDIMLVLGRADLRLRTTIEFGLLWLCALLLSIFFGIYWVAMAFTCAVVFYLPRALWLVLSLIQCPLKLYLEAVIVPILITLVSVGLYLEVAKALALHQYADIGLAALLALAAVVLSALVQLRWLLDESALLAVPSTKTSAVRQLRDSDE
jgi:O-antigen/teichoic acid export membrane protein